jgi:hypothetical protein
VQDVVEDLHERDEAGLGVGVKGRLKDLQQRFFHRFD